MLGPPKSDFFLSLHPHIIIEKVNLMSFQPFHPNTSRARVTFGLELELETNFNSNLDGVSKQGQ
jgi:hypothetical protein